MKDILNILYKYYYGNQAITLLDEKIVTLDDILRTYGQEINLKDIKILYFINVKYTNKFLKELTTILCLNLFLKTIYTDNSYFRALNINENIIFEKGKIKINNDFEILTPGFNWYLKISETKVIPLFEHLCLTIDIKNKKLYLRKNK